MIRLLTIVALVLSQTALACSFCMAPSLTMSERLDQSHIAVVATWQSTVKPDGQTAPTTNFQVQSVLRGDSVAPSSQLTIDRYTIGEPGDLFLLIGNPYDDATEDNPGELFWDAPLLISEPAADYLAKLPSPTAPEMDRLRFFLKHLEHEDNVVGNDAYYEFASVPNDVLVQLRSDMPREKLRQLVASSDTTSTHRGLYGFMLGICGDDSDRALMEDIVTTDNGDFRVGINGVIGGYLLLAGDPGLELVERTKFKDKNATFSETYAALQAVEFLWNEVPADTSIDRFRKERLRQSMRLLLDRTELTDRVIANMARWGDWSQLDAVYKLYDAPGYESISIKRAVMRFFMAAGRVKSNKPNAEQLALAEKHLADLTKQDPKLRKYAEQHFYRTE